MKTKTSAGNAVRMETARIIVKLIFINSMLYMFTGFMPKQQNIDDIQRIFQSNTYMYFKPMIVPLSTRIY